MSRRCLVSVFTLIACVALFPVFADAQSTASPMLPRTLWGDPDLQGIWNFSTATPMERPEELAGKDTLTEEEAAEYEQQIAEQRLADDSPNENAPLESRVGYEQAIWFERSDSLAEKRTSLIVDPSNGRLPDLSPVGQRRTDARTEYLEAHPADSYEDRNTSDRCIVGFNAGPPITPLAYNQNMQLFQTPDLVVVYTEMVHTARAVPLDGRPALDGGIRLWSGDSRGHWEGDTLVVETANFSDKRRWIPLGSTPAGLGSTANMTLVERFTRVDADTLEYTFTVSDPGTWTSAWTASMPMRRTDAPLFEYACHEGNYSMEGILSGHRADEKAAAQAAKQ